MDQSTAAAQGTQPVPNGRFQLQNGQQVGKQQHEHAGTATRNSMSNAADRQAQCPTRRSTTPTKQTMQDTLIKLVQTPSRPQSWSDVGGAGTIGLHADRPGLVINQTPDVQEQVAELLDALRRLSRTSRSPSR